MREGWNEAGVTYECYPLDENLSDPEPNCEDVWSGGYYEEYISGSIFQGNSTIGWQSFDVSSDIQLLQNGIEHYGWMIRKRDSSNPGSLGYTSREGSTSLRPRLVIMVDDQPCSPTVIKLITPGIIPADGSVNTIQVDGQELNNVTEVRRNGIPIQFSVIDENTLTFTDSATVVESDQFQLKASCIKESMSSYDVEAVDPVDMPPELQALEVQGACGAARSITLFSTDASGKYLCWNAKKVRLIGYSAFEEITWNNHFCGTALGTGPCGTPDNFAHFPKYMQAVRLRPAATNTHGVNLQRVFAFGGSFNTEEGLTGETMPFAKIRGSNPVKYNVSVGAGLDGIYTNRLISVLSAARDNGQAVELTLFPGSDMNYTDSAWNPNHNNMHDTCSQSNGGLSTVAFPKFYDICTTGNNNTNVCTSLTCLGKIEMNYVNNIVKVVQDNHFRNVFFEIMNEAPTPTTYNFIKYIKWHNTVASWIKANHNYFVSANVNHGDYSNITSCCSVCGSDSCSCSPSTCASNTNQVYLLDNQSGQHQIDIATFHCTAWQKSVPVKSACDTATAAAWRFKRPVIIDDDACVLKSDPAALRNNNCLMKGWALSITNCSALAFGRAHYNHLDEMKFMPVASTDKTVCHLTVEGTGTNRKLDCNALNQLADALPTNLCGNGLTCTCPPAEGQYCFDSAQCSGSGRCEQDVEVCP
jgi:hypothetical protein